MKSIPHIIAVPLAVLAAFPLHAQQVPALSIELLPPVRGWIADAVLRNDGRLVVSGWFSDTRTALAPQAVVLERDGRVAQRVFLPTYDTVVAFPNKAFWRCRAVFSDGSLLMDTNDGLFGREIRVRVFTDGRIDNSRLFPFGPVVTQPDGRIIVGGSDADSSGLPLERFFIWDNPWGSDLASEGGFSSRLTSHPGVKDMLCLNVALADDGRIWAWLREKTNDSGPARLFRFLSDGHVDPSFHPPQPVEGGNDLLPLPDGRLFVRRSDVSSIGGSPILQRLNSNGSEDASFRPNITGHVDPLLALEDGGLVVQVYGDETLVLVRLTPDGAVDTTFHPSSEVPLPVRRVLRQKDGKLWIIPGDYDTKALAFPIVMLNSDWTVDPAFNDRSLAAVPALRILADGLTPEKTYFLEENTSGIPGKWQRLKFPQISRIFGGDVLGLDAGLPGTMTLYRLVELKQP